MDLDAIVFHLPEQPAPEVEEDLDFAGLHAFAWTRDPAAQAERDARERAKSKAATDAYQAARASGATEDEAKVAARRAAGRVLAEQQKAA